MAEITSREQKKKVEEYRDVFNTVAGRKVLSDMVLDLRVFDAIAPGDTEGIALRNYGLSLLYNLGVITDKIIPTILDKMMDIEYTIKDGE